jgi:hypothetical protein
VLRAGGYRLDNAHPPARIGHLIQAIKQDNALVLRQALAEKVVREV